MYVESFNKGFLYWFADLKQYFLAQSNDELLSY